MSSIVQAPAPLPLQGVGDDPFPLTIQLEDASQNPLAGTSNPVVEIYRNGQPTGSTWLPTITNPSTGVYVLTWTAAQTAAILQSGWALSWSFSITLNGVGPLAVVAGTLAFTPDYVPGSSTSTTATVAVDLGANVVNVTANFGAAGVISFNGRGGEVVPEAGDYSVGEVTGAAPLSSPHFTDVPTAPTAAPLTDDTQLATTAYADGAVGVETARAEAAEATKLPLAGGTLTGALTTAGMSINVRSLAAGAATAQATDQYLRSNGNGSAVSYPLPAATGSGRVLILENGDTNGSPGIFTISPHGSDTIRGTNANALCVQFRDKLVLLDSGAGAWSVLEAKFAPVQWTSSLSWTCPLTGWYRTFLLGGGGPGGGAGSAALTGGTSNQVGGPGGGSGMFTEQVAFYTAGQSYAVTIGAGSNGGTGGAASSGSTGNPGSTGSGQGGTTSISGTGVSISVPGGGPGNQSLANWAATISGGNWGLSWNGSNVTPGAGGAATNPFGAPGGATPYAVGGSGGASASATAGGVGGVVTSAWGLATGSVSGQTAGTTGATGASATVFGCGGAGGGGGAPGGAGGHGGNGFQGFAMATLID